MLYSIKSLVVVLAISGAMFLWVRPMFRSIVPPDQTKRWMLIWVLATCIGFLVPNYWAMSFVLIGALLLFTRPLGDKPVLYLFLLMALPEAGQQIPGIFGINQFFAPTPPIYFSILFLIPAFFQKADFSQRSSTKVYSDYFVVSYFVLTSLLILRDASFTAVLRSLFVHSFGMILPYFALSRWPGDVKDLKKIIVAFVLPLSGLALIGLFEVIRSWNLYQHLPGFWGIYDWPQHYLYRDGMLRAKGSAVHSIPFGYLFMIGAGLLLALSASNFRGYHRYMLLGLLTAGLLSSISRGPVLGFGAVVFIYLILGDGKYKNIGRLVLIALLFVVPLIFTSVGQGLISYLPFVGSVDAGSVTYRVKLFENSMIVIMRSPLLGSVNFLEEPEMIEMIQGQGIVDLVNAYIQIALNYGFIGVALFAGVFLSILGKLWKIRKALPPEETELRQMGIGLIATLVGILLTITTVSSTNIVPILYWSIAGLSAGYIRVASRRIREFAALGHDEWVPAYKSKKATLDPEPVLT